MKNKRLYSIDFLKFIFAVLIAYSHFGVNLPGATIAVDFFFIISGFFLGRKYYKCSFKKNEQYNQENYTLDHIQKLYPHYIFHLLLCFATTW